jgi:hypothetical protein
MTKCKLALLGIHQYFPSSPYLVELGLLVAIVTAIVQQFDYLLLRQYWGV